MRHWILDLKPGPPKPRDGLPATEAAAPAANGIDWSQRLQAAAGDDGALLALARDRVPLQVKLAAVEALAGEAALKQAEHEFRDHDRRVHRLAKQRHQQVVATREARTQAATLIDAARALARQDDIPANHLVDLDRAWRALDAALLEPAQRDDFAALMAQMAAITRDRADRPQRLRRWSEQARAALQALERACLEAASGELDRGALEAAGVAVRECATTAPDDAGGVPAGTALLAALAQAEALRVRLDGRLVLLDGLLSLAPPAAGRSAAPARPEDADVDADARVNASGNRDVIASADADGSPDATASATASASTERHTATDHVGAALQRWSELPPLGDAALDERLQQRVARWQQAREDARSAQRALRRERARERQRAVRDERLLALGATLERAEAELEAGQLAATHVHLVEVDRLLEGGATAGELRARIDALQARYAQLKGWQHWAGGRARDELVQQAEALAAVAVRPAAGPPRLGESPPAERSTPPVPSVPSMSSVPTAPADPSAPSAPSVTPVPSATSAPAVPTVPRGPKLTPHLLAGLIDDMRARWKELDRLGGATSRSLWQRFDTALRTAYQPVAAQVEAQRAARAENQRTREQLLAELEALPMPGDDEGMPEPDWRALAGRLDHFRTAWRRLGPIEHTVPHQARAGLVARMTAALQRLEAPLEEARRGARREREALVARARGLAVEATGRDLGVRARELQAQWQQQARSLPLARADESALWTEFKAALDGAFGAREAAFAAREAEFRAQAAERAALIARLEGLDAELPEVDLRRTLAEVEAAWRRAGPAPRPEAAALEARFERACERMRREVAGAGQRRWQASCDALVAKIALCEELEREANRDAAGVDVRSRWSALPVLPEPLEQALLGRAGLDGAAVQGSAVLAKATTDELLLQLEAAWGLASPADCEAARRQLRLQAMKAALETRRPASAPSAPATPGQWLAALLRRPTLDAGQRERLAGVLAELRRRGPAGLR